MNQEERKLSCFVLSHLEERLKKRLGNDYGVFLKFLESSASSWRVAKLFELEAYEVTLWRSVLTIHKRQLVVECEVEPLKVVYWREEVEVQVEQSATG